MIRFSRMAAAVALASTIAVGTADAAGLAGSPASMRQQYSVAKSEDLTFLRTASQVRSYASDGKLDTVPGNADYKVNKVSFPYAQPEVVRLIERIAQEYRDATGEQLVVTSLTRPTTLQPKNAHKLSVHPAGMAVDLRIPANAESRKWLETRLLELEGKGVLDVTREKSPPHYHVAVFPGKFRDYAEKNPLPPRPEPVEEVEVTEAFEPTIAAAADVTTEADAGAGFGAWAITALGGMILAGGAMARRRIPVLIERRRVPRD